MSRRAVLLVALVAVGALVAVRELALPAVGERRFAEGVALAAGDAAAGDLNRAADAFASAAAWFGWAGARRREADAVFQHAYWLEPHHNRFGGWDQSLRAFERAAVLYDRIGALDGLGESLHFQAHALEPGNHPDGDWARAAELHGHAAEVLERVGDHAGIADSRYGQAFALQADHNPESGSWSEAIRLYELAAEAAKKAGDDGFAARAYHQLGYCERPDVNPGGAWSRTVSWSARAASHYGAVGDRGGQATSLRQQAIAMAEGDTTAFDAEARQVLEVAAELFERAGAFEAAGEIERWLAR